MTQAKTLDRKIIVTIDDMDRTSPNGDPPAVVVILMSGVQFTCKFSRRSTAHAACIRLAREHKLWKMAGVWIWRSKS